MGSLASYSVGSCFISRFGDSLSVTSPVSAGTVVVPQYLRPLPLPSFSFPVHPSAVTVPIVTVVRDASCLVKYVNEHASCSWDLTFNFFLNRI